jgi:hypothetical protein
MYGVGSKLQWVALVAGLALVLTVLAVWFWTLHSPSLGSASLSAAEVQKIREVVTKKRWEMAHWALRKREFTLLRRFVLARIESVEVASAASAKATVQCRPAFESDVRVIMIVERQGTNGWSFERWLVTEQTRKAAPRQALPGTSSGDTNAPKSGRPEAHLVTSLDAPKPLLCHSLCEATNQSF